MKRTVIVIAGILFGPAAGFTEDASREAAEEARRSIRKALMGPGTPEGLVLLAVFVR